MEYDYVRDNELAPAIFYDELEINSEINGAATRFFINSCGFSIGDMFRLNEIVHNDMVRFAESGKTNKPIELFNEEKLKEIEKDQHRLFSNIRSDQHRKELGLSNNIDWYPLFDYSYVDRGYADG